MAEKKIADKQLTSTAPYTFLRQGKGQSQVWKHPQPDNKSMIGPFKIQIKLRNTANTPQKHSVDRFKQWDSTAI